MAPIRQQHLSVNGFWERMFKGCAVGAREVLSSLYLSSLADRRGCAAHSCRHLSPLHRQRQGVGYFCKYCFNLHTGKGCAVSQLAAVLIRCSREHYVPMYILGSESCVELGQQ